MSNEQSRAGSVLESETPILTGADDRDVDPSERAEDLRAYVEREGFDWPFAMADATLADTLRDRLGQAFMFPPNTPMVLLMPDGEVRPLEFGGYSVDELLAELGA